MHALFSVLFLCIGLLFGVPCSATAANAPSCFVYVKVLPSGEVTVVENLKGFGPKLERPLDFLDRPYSSRSPFVQEPPMEVVSVKVNGRAVAPEIVRTNVNGEVSSRLLLTSGDTSRPTHDYSVTYKTSSRVLFKSDVDRIVWDVWGRGPSGVILSCAVSLPEGAKVSLQEARLGHETGGHRPVKSWIAKDGAALFKALEPLGERESFEVAVEWNKGVVASDGSEAIVSTVNIAMWGLFAVLLAACGGLWFIFGRDPHPKPAAPLFYPPEGPDGRPLSPAAMAYIRNAAYLPSRGFAALLMNLAAQKMVELTGTGTRKDPYNIYTPAATAEKVNAEAQRILEAQANVACNEAVPVSAPEKIAAEGTTQRQRRHWLEALEAGRGFDDAEVLTYHRLFETWWTEGEEEPRRCVTLSGDRPWLIASLRETAYVELARLYRGLWNLRTDLVLFMFMLCYGAVLAMQAWLWSKYGGDMYVTLAVTAAVGIVCFLCRKLAESAHRLWMKWQEMGTATLAVLGLYACLLPVIVLYDVLLEPGFGFPLQNIMDGWGWLRVLLWLGLGGWLIFKVKNVLDVLLRPWQLLLFVILFFFGGGLVFAFSNFSNLANLALFGILLMPLAFMPIMKQPAKRAMPILADIEGFAMYIGAAEAQRMNFQNPPDRTPEEFHRILPYAVALGLEEAWGAQFSDMFKEMRFTNSMATFAEYEHRMNGDA
ncbi:DUF2207 family protein [Mailhella sp.]